MHFPAVASERGMCMAVWQHDQMTVISREIIGPQIIFFVAPSSLLQTRQLDRLIDELIDELPSSIQYIVLLLVILVRYLG